MADIGDAGVMVDPHPRLAETVAEQRRRTVSREIENVALDLYVSRPVAEVTVDEIAKGAKVSVRTFHRYFPSKDEVFAALPRRGAEQLARAVRDRPATESSYDAIRNGVIESASVVSDAEQTRWITALVQGAGWERVARISFLTMKHSLTSALADRLALPRDDLGAQVAGAIASATIEVGWYRWHLEGGDLLTHELEALEAARHAL